MLKNILSLLLTLLIINCNYSTVMANNKDSATDPTVNLNTKIDANTSSKGQFAKFIPKDKYRIHTFIKHKAIKCSETENAGNIRDTGIDIPDDNVLDK